jgi:hypothetical protein
MRGFISCAKEASSLIRGEIDERFIRYFANRSDKKDIIEVLLFRPLIRLLKRPGLWEVSDSLKFFRTNYILGLSSS